jgi:hypothetical protein
MNRNENLTDDKQMQEAAKRNQRSSTNETNVGRREFIKTAGLGAIALGAGFGASRAFDKRLPRTHTNLSPRTICRFTKI